MSATLRRDNCGLGGAREEMSKLPESRDQCVQQVAVKQDKTSEASPTFERLLTNFLEADRGRHKQERTDTDSSFVPRARGAGRALIKSSYLDQGHPSRDKLLVPGADVRSKSREESTRSIRCEDAVAREMWSPWERQQLAEFLLTIDISLVFSHHSAQKSTFLFLSRGRKVDDLNMCRPPVSTHLTMGDGSRHHKSPEFDSMDSGLKANRKSSTTLARRRASRRGHIAHWAVERDFQRGPVVYHLQLVFGLECAKITTYSEICLHKSHACNGRVPRVPRPFVYTQ
ncbi:hypothetical protein RRG08_022625 [Elysia crispata]|uniref:Uncharacterized protein n=1 Tax=Elysia crispata TaxID=231223 RepID=A0AAE0Z204_9GAST|nr:hypothetical protein RRG08_022625 [Elysia crispata]